jgi:cytochrome c553
MISRLAVLGALAAATAVTGALAAAMAVTGAQAQPKAAVPKPDLAAGQKIAVQQCAACHAADGNSTLPANPVLAGQHAAYTAKQLRDYQSGLRLNAVMQGFAAQLSPEDIRNVAAFYAAQKPRPGQARDKELAALGEKLFRGGNAATGLPSCSGCHSPNGAGLPAQFPRLAGQHAEYTAAQLRAFRSGERANDTNRMMRMIAARLSDREIAALAEAIAGLR